ncbi:MAG TPA: ABC transporter ATP-binding protein [Candidatus Binatia bacterium]|jgi:ABC-type sugar transport system ATPase subunit|nr:ABC transporter ATP-binding protein [Candidatus Binatia bacterium]
MARVELTDVQKRFPDGTVGVADFSLVIDDRELLVLVGPSGCGKSTVLRMVAGLETATSGTIRIGDRVVNDIPPQQRNVAMVFQDYALYPHMTVRKNLEFPLRMRRLGRDDMARQVDRVAGLLEIGQLLDRLPKQLSGGQRQRVAMGRALVREPAASLLDEPLSNLDPRLRVQVRAEIKELQAKTGTTMIYVTHDQVEAMTLGHRVAVMDKGRLQQVDTPRALYAEPANVMVAGFVGNPPMNLFPAVRAKGGLGLGGGVVSLDAEIGDGWTAGVRPEGIALGTETSPVHATVEHIEELGHESLAHLRLPGIETPVIARLTGMPDIAAGREVPLAIDPAQVRLFDAEGRLVR